MSKEKQDTAKTANDEVKDAISEQELESAAGGIVYPINGGTYPLKTDAGPRGRQSADTAFVSNTASGTVS